MLEKTKRNWYKYVAVVGGEEIYFTTQADGALKLGTTRDVVSAALHGRSNSLDKRGISLFKINEYEDKKPIREHKINNKRWTSAMCKKRKVYMLDPYTHEKIDFFESITEAVEDLGINPKSIGNIGRCCRGEIKTAFGFKWEFAE